MAAKSKLKPQANLEMTLAFAHYAPGKLTNLTTVPKTFCTVNDIINEAVDPSNECDGVLSDLYREGELYGLELVEKLKTSLFKGSVAIQTSASDKNTNLRMRAKDAGR